jgi:hypothetical protein
MNLQDAFSQLTQEIGKILPQSKLSPQEKASVMEILGGGNSATKDLDLTGKSNDEIMQKMESLQADSKKYESIFNTLKNGPLNGSR